MKKLFGIFMICAITLSMSSCLTRVGAGYTGVKYSYAGDDKGQPIIEPAVGWVGYVPGLSTVIEFPTSMQHYVWTANSGEGKVGNEEISIPMKGGASFLCDVGFNYKVKPNQAGKIYFNYKTENLDDITQGYLRTTVRNCMKDVSGVITMDSLLNNLPGYEASVRTILADSLNAQGFILEQFSLVSAPRPADPNIAAAISNKIKAKQDAETAVTQLQISVAEANKRIAAANGDATALVARAKGESEANRLRQQSLTPLLVQQQFIDKWDGALPQYGTTPQLFKDISK